jgi:hypothetical protein
MQRLQRIVDVSSLIVDCLQSITVHRRLWNDLENADKGHLASITGFTADTIHV